MQASMELKKLASPPSISASAQNVSYAQKYLQDIFNIPHVGVRELDYFYYRNLGPLHWSTFSEQFRQGEG